MPTVAIIDSQSAKTTGKGGARGYDAGKKIKGRKRHIAVDTQGNPSYEKKKKVGLALLYRYGILSGPPRVPPKSFWRSAALRSGGAFV